MNKNTNLVEMAERDVYQTQDIEQFINITSPAIVKKGKDLAFFCEESDANIRIQKLNDSLNYAIDVNELKVSENKVYSETGKDLERMKQQNRK